MKQAIQSERLETALLCLRDPLSRIALAVGQIDEGGGPENRAVRTIRQAVDEIDARLDDTLASLAPGVVSAPESVTRIVSELIHDLAPAFEARGIALVLGALEEGVAADEAMLRRVVCRLLLGAGHWMDGCEGRIHLTSRRSEERDPARVGIRIAAEVTRGTPSSERRDVLSALRGFAPGETLAVEGEALGGEMHATVWLEEEVAE